MFGLGVGEIILIAIVALILFGDQDLPKNIKKFAQWMTDFKKTTSEMQRSWYQMRDDMSRTIMSLEEEEEKKNPPTTDVAATELNKPDETQDDNGAQPSLQDLEEVVSEPLPDIKPPQEEIVAQENRPEKS